MATAHPKRRTRAPSGPLLAVLLTAALLVIAAASWLYANRSFVRFIPFEQDAEYLLEQMIADSKLPVAQAGAIEQLAEGAEMDTARRMLVIPATAEAVRAGFRRGCRRAGLGAPNAMTLGWEPDALCEGAWHHGTATVGIQLNCTRSCRATVTVYHAWF